MSGLRFEFEAYGDKLVSRELVDMGGRSIDARPAFTLIADDLMASEKRRFNSRGFSTWAPLAESTIASKARRGLDPRVLHATTRLRDSLTRKHDPHQVLIIEPQFLVLGTNLDYAGYLQTGTRRMPARKPLGFPVGQRRKAIKRIQKFVVTGNAVL
jgi:hypothetical protein